MAIDFACSCGKKLRARDDMAGKQGRCKACGSLYNIPQPSLPVTASVRKQAQLPAATRRVAVRANAPVMVLDESDVIEDAPLDALLAPSPQLAVLTPGALPMAGALQAPSSGLPNWLVPAVAIGGVVVLGVVGLAIALSSTRGRDTALENRSENPTAPVANEPAATATSESGDSRMPSLATSKPTSSTTWGNGNTPASAASGKPAASAPAWSSEIADSNAPRQPWSHPAIPAGFAPKVQIPAQNLHGDQVLYAEHHAPFAIVGTDCWNLATGQKSGKIGREMQRGANRVRSLSSDGKWFAEAMDDSKVEIWACEKGERLTTLELKAQSGSGVKYIAFRSPQRLLTVNTNPFVSWIQQWDVGNNFAMVHDFNGPKISQPEAASLSGDGKHMALVSDAQVQVFDVEKGKLVAQMAQPKSGPGIPPLHLVSAVKFSPDGSELLAAAEHGARLICWNSRAEIVFDKKLTELGLPENMRISHRDELQWSPDATAWLLNGRYLVLRELERAVWQLGDTWHVSGDSTHFLDKDHLLVRMTGGNQEHLVGIPIPWARLNAAVAAMKGNTAALLRPGQAVSVQVKLGDLRHADSEQTKAALEQAAQEKLKQSGIQVGEQQGVVLFVHYEEKSGGEVAVFERRNRFDFRGQDTGQRVEDTQGELQVSLWEAGAKEPLWKTTMQARSSRTFESEITAQSVRESTFKSAVSQLRGQFLPYFLPKDQSVLSLPAVTALQMR